MHIEACEFGDKLHTIVWLVLLPVSSNSIICIFSGVSHVFLLTDQVFSPAKAWLDRILGAHVIAIRAGALCDKNMNPGQKQISVWQPGNKGTFVCDWMIKKHDENNICMETYIYNYILTQSKSQYWNAYYFCSQLNTNSTSSTVLIRSF